MTKQSHSVRKEHLARTGILPVIPFDGLAPCPADGDCFGLHPRNDMLMALLIVFCESSF